VTSIDLLRCPLCGCMFISDLDRQRHLDAYGREKSMHLERLRIIHEEAEEEVQKAHGRADQVVFELSREVLREKRRRLERMAARVLREEGF
jgi:hypothetical protein